MKALVVTGGASGIGREISLTAAERGIKVIIGDCNKAAADDVCQEISDAGGEAIALPLDVTVQTSVREFYSSVDALCPTIDALVTAAGITFGERLVDLTLEQWQRAIGVNLTGTFLCVQAAAQRMLRNGGGAIVTFASITALSGTATRAAYAASKGGVIAMMKTAAIELGQSGVRINTVAPGNVETPMTAAQHTGPGAPIRNAYLARTPAGRYANPREIAEVTLFLCTDAASYINGTVLTVDGGYTSTGMMF